MLSLLRGQNNLVLLAWPATREALHFNCALPYTAEA